MTGEMEKSTQGIDRGRSRKNISAFAAVLLLISATVAQGAYFDTAGKSARQVGMGEVFMASTGDASGYWYNPAGLARFERKQAGLSYGMPMSSLSGLMASQVNVVTPLSAKSGLGFGVSYSGLDISHDLVVSGGYGIALTDRFAIGGNAKLMRWAFEGQKDPYTGKVDENLSKMSFSLDLSATYSLGEYFGLGNFTTGVFVKDALMPNISKSGDDGGKLPIETRIGLMMQRSDLTTEIDLAQVDGVSSLRVGAESAVAGSALRVRGGLVYGSDFKGDAEKTDIAFGLGYNFGSIGFNYALNIPFVLQKSSGKHYISFGVSF